MAVVRFDRLVTDVKVTALAAITRHVTTILKSEGITKDSTPEDLYQRILDKKISDAITNYGFTEDGSIIEESTRNIKGVLDYGKDNI
jgi:uncharacterized protein with ATP-grasp and redox domains